MRVVLIEYNGGNSRSVVCALRRLGIEPQISSDPEVIRKADRVIFPGVGEASSTMAFLRSHQLDKLITELKQPFLGICLGMQLLANYSEENQTECLKILPVSVTRFGTEQKVPQIGWNQVYQLKGHLFKGISEGSFFYFVHSYFVPPHTNSLALCDYGETFSAAISKDNYHAVQFHPEKSHQVGSRLLSNFLEL